MCNDTHNDTMIAHNDFMKVAINCLAQKKLANNYRHIFSKKLILLYKFLPIYDNIGMYFAFEIGIIGLISISYLISILFQ